MLKKTLFILLITALSVIKPSDEKISIGCHLIPITVLLNPNNNPKNGGQTVKDFAEHNKILLKVTKNDNSHNTKQHRSYFEESPLNLFKISNNFAENKNDTDIKKDNNMSTTREKFKANINARYTPSDQSNITVIRRPNGHLKFIVKKNDMINRANLL